MTNIQDLRKIYSAQGIKGFSSANRAAFNADIEAAHELALLSEASRESAKQVKPKSLADVAENVVVIEAAPAPAKKSNKCGICGLRKNYSGAGEKAPRSSEMCNPCFAEGGWENTHSDHNHNTIAEIIEHAGHDQLSDSDKAEVEFMAECWICHPELNLAKAEPKAGRSRAGMVIVAKGSEIHKSETFRVAAESAGWSVTMLRETYELEENAEGEGTRYYATARRGNDWISLAWDGRAYDYPGSSSEFGGKARKVRNLKEALRLL
jgi:hypothetical protein